MGALIASDDSISIITRSHRTIAEEKCSKALWPNQWHKSGTPNPVLHKKMVTSHLFNWCGDTEQVRKFPSSYRESINSAIKQSICKAHFSEPVPIGCRPETAPKLTWSALRLCCGCSCCYQPTKHDDPYRDK